MLYFSTNRNSEPVSLKEAVIGGLAADGGLYMPVQLPTIPASQFDMVADRSFSETAYDVALEFFRDDIPGRVILDIVEDSFDFPLPLNEVKQGIFSMELYHGPTLAFKDIGARFMSRLMSWLYRNEERELNVVVATSGDTGSAVAAGFHNVEGINVFILFPRAKVSPLQQKQITTWGDNIHAIEVDGSFDDCQKLAKQLLADRELNNTLSVTSANSINIGRLIPQTFYYFYAFSQLKGLRVPVVFSVPSGNFGNITGGIMAMFSGLPVKRFIASININDVFKKFLESGIYKAEKSIETLSNAMDVGDPSNFARLNEMMGGKSAMFRKYMSAYSFTDQATLEGIDKVYRDTGYIMDPHGAVAFLGAEQFLEEQDEPANVVFLETAHPAKFRETINRVIKDYAGLPPQLKAVVDKKEKYHSAGNDIDEIRSFIGEINRISM